MTLAKKSTIDISHALSVQGWMSEVELNWLAETASRSENIVEIGSYLGRSSSALAANTTGTVYCVDRWDDTPYGVPIDRFRANTSRFLNLVPIHEASILAAAEFAAAGKRFDMIFIDAGHDAQYLREDIAAWQPLLAEGGIICGHDYGNTDWPDVKPVVDELIPGVKAIDSIWIAPAVADYCAFVPVVNRPDLLQSVVASAVPLWENLTIIDNSPDGWVLYPPPMTVFRPSVPLTFAQTMNWAIEETLRRNKRFCVTIHSDAVIPEGACEQVLEFAHQIYVDHPRWGAIFTHYDVLAVHNPVAFQDIGGWDTNLPWYFSDNDYFRRLKLAGWECIDSGIQIGHLASQTINSDPYLRHLNGITFPLHGEYYRQKWGGTPGEERFTHPFGVLPKEWKLMPNPLTYK